MIMTKLMDFYIIQGLNLQIPLILRATYYVYRWYFRD